jgi:hypothetical protein
MTNQRPNLLGGVLHGAAVNLLAAVIGPLVVLYLIVVARERGIPSGEILLVGLLLYGSIFGALFLFQGCFVLIPLALLLRRRYGSMPVREITRKFVNAAIVADILLWLALFGFFVWHGEAGEPSTLLLPAVAMLPGLYGVLLFAESICSYVKPGERAAAAAPEKAVGMSRFFSPFRVYVMVAVAGPLSIVLQRGIDDGWALSFVVGLVAVGAAEILDSLRAGWQKTTPPVPAGGAPLPDASAASLREKPTSVMICDRNITPPDGPAGSSGRLDDSAGQDFIEACWSQPRSGEMTPTDPTDPTPRMLEFYERRTKEHIDRVARCLMLLAEGSSFREELLARARVHDASKFGPEERIAYVWLTEYHRCRQSSEPFRYPPGMAERVQAAIHHHVTSNRHHPEFHADPNDMTDVDLIEMVCDWTAMAQEFGQDGGSARGWADKTIGKRVLFNADKCRFIYQIIDELDRRIAAA